MTNTQEILKQFGIEVDADAIRPLGSGLINDTFRVTTPCNDTPDYVLQRINHAIFTDVDCLQRNIEAATNHIRRKLEAKGTPDIARHCLRFLQVPSTGKTYYYDGNSYWRVMEFIPDAYTYDAVTPEYAYYAGLGFGDFESMLADIPEKLEESIPDFHNMELRLRQLEEAIAADKAGRVAGVADLIEQLRSRADHACLAERLHREGKLPKRICHCDTKVNNMLFDADGNILCVIDLDTMMPSFVFSDFGDFMRTAANTAAEDEPNTDLVNFNMEVFEAFTRGYLQSAGGFLTDVEIENLPYAAERFAYMQAIRFLADYLNGDTYYKIQYPEHNLVRTRAQFKLLQSIDQHLDEMKAVVDKYRKK